MMDRLCLRIRVPQDCMHIIRDHLSRRKAPIDSAYIQYRQFSCSRIVHSQRSKSTSRVGRGPSSLSKQAINVSHHKVGIQNSSLPRKPIDALQQDVQRIAAARDTLLASAMPPSEIQVDSVLKECEQVAMELMKDQEDIAVNNDVVAASALLFIDATGSTRGMSPIPSAASIEGRTMTDICDVASSLLSHPSVFITPMLLRRYVDMLVVLQMPSTLPAIFQLYASKPVLEEGSSPPRYLQANSNKASNVISLDVADRALRAAIDAKELDTAMGIVDNAYATTAFRRAKFIRKGLLPVTGLAIAPMAAYAVATQLSQYQNTMDPAMATNVAFAGILAYVGFTSTIGIVAVTTANDQMERITWAIGMPLRERWIREEERAAVDRIACAWGFRQSWKRGEEEGPEWDTLREWVGQKGMILDRTSLLEGME